MSICKSSVIEYLEEYIEYIMMRFFYFVKQDYRI